MANIETAGSSASTLKKIADSFDDIIAPERRNNLSPILQRPIDQHVGIQIEGQFKTNDASSDGKMSYITARRHSNIAVPFDGYGIAWRVGDGSKYNLYIVDNDALLEDIFINEEQLWDQTGGTNQFLAAASIEILKDIWYKYVIKIYDKNGIDVWIYKASNPPGTLDSNNRSIYRGQTYPPYIPQSSGDHFGISVIETENWEWWYRNLKITSITENYPMQLFKIKTPETNFPSGEAFSLTYYGIGWGDTENSLKWYVRNQNTDVWDLCGSNTKGVGSTLSEMKMIKSLTDIDTYRDNTNFVNVLATPYNYNDDEHYLRSYHISALNTLLSGIHRGNMTDIYIEDKAKIKIATQSVIMTSQELNLRTNDSFSLPVVDIIALSRTLTNTAYIENTDYTVTRPTQGTAFSTKDDIKIVFNDSSVVGVSVDVLYRYYSDGVSVQALLDSDQYRYAGTDNLGKIVPLTIVNIEHFDFKGPVLVETIQTALIDAVNAISDGRLEISDLVNAAYTAGATYVDLTTMDISVKDHEYLGTYIKKDVTNTYTITGLKQYFCDTTSAYGINKLD